MLLSSAEIDIFKLVNRKLAAEIECSTDIARSDRLWPSDPIIFQTNALSLAHGAAGTALFLYRENGALQPDTLAWLLKQKPDPASIAPGLYTGLAGVAVCFSQMGLVERGEDFLKAASNSSLLEQRCDIYSGLAGYGLALLHFARITGKSHYLDAAEAVGRMLVKRVRLEEGLATWTAEDDGLQRVGFASGSSGIGLFLLYLWLSTQDGSLLAVAQSAVEADIVTAKEDISGLSWPVTKLGSDYRPYWFRGGGGVVEVLARFGSILNEERYLDVARQGAQICGGFFSAGPQLFEGLASMGSTLLDIYLCTGDASYLEASRQKAIQTLFFRIERGENLAFPGRFLQRISHDYGMGGAGIGIFLQRLIRCESHPIHDLVPTGTALTHAADKLWQKVPAYAF